jgi:hypothetical protein
VVAHLSIQAQLKAYKDSLHTTNVTLVSLLVTDEQGNTTIADTTITHTATYTGGLFQVSCYVSFSDGCLNIRENLTVLRPTRIDHTLVESAPGFVESIVYLPDFDMTSTEVITLQLQPEPKRSFWQENRTHILAYGSATLIAITLIRTLIGG